MEERNDLPPASEGTTAPAETPSFFSNTQDLVERYMHCAICGSNLHFTHVTDFVKDLTYESARCPECGIQVRKVMHRLQ